MGKTFEALDTLDISFVPKELIIKDVENKITPNANAYSEIPAASSSFIRFKIFFILLFIGK